GEIVVTPIHNQTWGLTRFGTGDLSSYITGACSCGRTANRLTGIVGRASDAVKVRGLFVIARQAEELFSSFSEIARYQLIVGRRQHRDEITLRLELKDTDIDKTKLNDVLNRRFQDTCRIKIDKIEFVAPGSIPDERQCIVDERSWE
ncbi:MAG: phenylacetate--CoA ligase family protein, partial [Dehalococcoidales bacterium]|nr:phenylacetate--CoA ligase family protein [Dehalococcoidales bacterium]